MDVLIDKLIVVKNKIKSQAAMLGQKSTSLAGTDVKLPKSGTGYRSHCFFAIARYLRSEISEISVLFT
jgi:hypothetical protein